jgi:PAS domain S-box-containing protein
MKNIENTAQSHKPVKRISRYYPENIRRMSAQDIFNLLEKARLRQTDLEKQIEELLRRQELLSMSRDTYRELFINSPIGYLTLSLENVILQANHTAANLLGAKKNDLVGESFIQFIPAGEQPAFQSFQRQICASLNKSRYMTQLLRKDRSLVPVRLECLLSINEANQADWILIALIDVSGDSPSGTRLSPN